MSWFHYVTGAEAENMLKAANIPVGTYLVRPSADTSGTYALSVKENIDNVCHIKIVHEDDLFQLFGRPEQFVTINEMIRMYVENPKMLKLKEGTEISGGFLTLQDPYPTGDNIRKEKWFHGQIDGYSAQQLLKDYGKSGSFLVRESHSTPGAFVLVVKCEDEVRNIKINKSQNQYDIGCGDKFRTVSELVDYYLKRPIIVKPGAGDSNPSGPVLLQNGLPSTRVPAKDFVRKFRNEIEQLEQKSTSTSTKTLQTEFENLQFRKSSRKTYEFSAGMKPENVGKNRSKQILPFDFNRVMLPNSDNDYINASYVTVSFEHNMKRKYILTQTPLKDTVDDFWKMIWANNVEAVVMLTERPKRLPVVDYWDVKGEGSSFKIRVEKQTNYFHPNADVPNFQHPSQSSLSGQHWITSELEVIKKNPNQGEPERRRILHYKFTRWDTYPPDPQIFVEFVEKIRDRLALTSKEDPSNIYHRPHSNRSGRNPSAPPIVVHDLMGIGRAGVFIAVDSLVRFTTDTAMRCDIDIAKLVLDLRTQRADTVQLSGQYEFIYKCIHCHLTRLESVLDTQKLARAKGHDYTNVGGTLSPASSTSTIMLPPPPTHLTHNIPQLTALR